MEKVHVSFSLTLLVK